MNFRKYNGILLVKPSKKSIDKITDNISNTIKRAKAWKQEELIASLNSLITGWATYYQTVVSSEIFNKIDNRIWHMLWHWAKEDIQLNPDIGLPTNIGILMERGSDIF